MQWPNERDVGRAEDMGQGHLRVVLDGDNDVCVEVFDGKLRIDAMTLERPLGVAPTLTAEVARRPAGQFEGEHVLSSSELPLSAADGQVYFVGNWAARDGAFFQFRDGRWQQD